MNDLIASSAAYPDSLIGGEVCVIVHGYPGWFLGLGLLVYYGTTVYTITTVVTIKA
jgi:hypothetical protein